MQIFCINRVGVKDSGSAFRVGHSETTLRQDQDKLPVRLPKGLLRKKPFETAQAFAFASSG